MILSEAFLSYNNVMFHFICLLISFNIFAANESLYKQILEPKEENLYKGVTRPKVVAVSPRYELDINEDAEFEFIQTEKRDGIDFFYIKGARRNVIFKMKLQGLGDQSHLYKVQLKRINKKTNVLILYFDEGFIEAYNFAKTARLYFVTIDNKNLDTIYGYKGPHFFIEEQTPHNNYENRRYSVTTFDYNSDNQNEISVKYKSINRVFSYLGKGEWLRF